jgi:putative two-component system response regulator
MTAADSRPKLLVVDDAPANIRVLRNLLREEARVLFATSGQEALDSARREQPCARRSNPTRRRVTCR